MQAGSGSNVAAAHATWHCARAAMRRARHSVLLSGGQPCFCRLSRGRRTAAPCRQQGYGKQQRSKSAPHGVRAGGHAPRGLLLSCSSVTGGNRAGARGLDRASASVVAQPLAPWAAAASAELAAAPATPTARLPAASQPHAPCYALLRQIAVNAVRYLGPEVGHSALHFHRWCSLHGSCWWRWMHTAISMPLND